jgi:hypothetical protein
MNTLGPERRGHQKPERKTGKRINKYGNDKTFTQTGFLSSWRPERK